MTTTRKTGRWVLSGILLLGLTGSAFAATPAEQLDKATELFQQADYEQAKKALLDIDRDKLNAEQKQKRDELLEEVGTAINQSTKARQDLEDADKAFDANDRAASEKLYRSVQNNNYATAAQKQRARQGMAMIAKQRELEEKLNVQPKAKTQPAAEPPAPKEPRGSARAEQETPATRPAAAPSSRPSSDLLSSARAERNRAEATRLIHEGDNAAAEGKYDEAEKRFQEANKLVPNHPGALKGLEIVTQHRAVEGRPNIIEETEQRRIARWERTERVYRQNEGEIRAAINNKRFDEARQKLGLTRQLLEGARADARPPERYTQLTNALDSLARYIESEQKEVAETEAAEQRNQAIVKERERRQLDMKERDQRIGQLFDQAMQLRKENQYGKAADVLREIIAIDPTYERAQWMLESLEAAHLIKKQAVSQKQFLSHMQQSMVEAEKARNPLLVGADNEIQVFPSEDEWRMIANRDPFGVGLSGETEEDRRARQQMGAVISEVVFPEGTGFEEVIEFLRKQGRVSIDVNWNALQAGGIDKTTDTLGINLHNVKLETALKLLLDNVGGAVGAVLSYNVVDGIIRVSTKEALDRDTFPRVYDIQDLLIQIRSFQAPSNTMGGGMMGGGMMGGGMGGGMMGGGMMGGGMMGGGMMGGGMGGMMGGGGGGFGGGGGGGFGGGGGSGSGQGDDDSSEEQRKKQSDDFKDLIKKLIEPGTWEPEGTVGSLNTWNDRLIVRHTASAHRQLVELFKQLRESKDIQVSIEARFITMSSNFLEEIGVDLDVVLNNGNAGLDRTLGPGGIGQATDPVTGAHLLQPRRFSQYGFAPGVPGLGQPLTSTATPSQAFGNAALVPPGSPGNYYSRHTTAIPIINNTLDLAQPVATIVPGSADTVGRANSSPGFQMFGSFLDNIQLDFLMRATQLDIRSSSVEAPRLVVFNNRGAWISVGSNQSFIFTPGFLPVGGNGVGGVGAAGQNPTIGTANSSRTFAVTPTVSSDRKYVTMQLKPNVQSSDTSSATSALGPLQLLKTDYTTIQTYAVVPDRGTILLGGLKLSGESETEAGVPVLSKIPVLKRAFTNRSRVKDERIVLILIKPTIIIPQEQEKDAFPDLSTATQAPGAPALPAGGG